ncbi:LOW QUALITY PROTEIN: Retrovirus-related Pol Polyprotein [Phytophthora palmivora]|uniref:Retrovirus-related Pol Polyprotein n=1 Tax=Phytophthora palmivora TaxID=4796 RepID=A0A2P4X941_9STRA|nr:LOW QUALITY PROTEIN: Retrovirus-related Pol Polyprotein [Phytophthora palmivora]
MTDVVGVSYRLGWTIERNRANRSIFIYQKNYATKQVLNAKSAPIAQKLSATDCPTDDEAKTIMANKPYREGPHSPHEAQLHAPQIGRCKQPRYTAHP